MTVAVVSPARSAAQIEFASIRELQVVRITSTYVFEVQEIVVAGAQGGNFALTVGGKSTAALRHNIAASDLQNAVAASSISGATGCGTISVTRTPVRACVVDGYFFSFLFHRDFCDPLRLGVWSIWV